MKQFYRSTFGSVAGIFLVLAILLGIDAVKSFLEKTVNWLSGGGGLVLLILGIVFFRLGWKGK